MSSTLNFRIRGGKKLKGSVDINSSKNGAVGLLCASLLNRGTTVLTHMPKIEEVHRLIEVLESLGVAVTWSESKTNGNTVTIVPPKKISFETINRASAERTRSILMFTGSLIHHYPEFSLPQAGGCKLGSRTVRPHLYALEKFGVNIIAQKDRWVVSREKLHAAEVVMYESGDTATINALLAAAGIAGTSTIKFASANYQVQEICHFLQALGVHIEGIGSTTLTITGKKNISRSVTYAVSEDPTDAMFFLAAAIVTHSSITIRRCPIDFLELELLKLEKMGFRYEILKRHWGRGNNVRLVDIQTHPSTLVASPEKLYGRPYPGLNIDNLPFFAVIATQAKGTTLIHDWVYEKRALYFTELDKLGGSTLLADPHRIYITGPSKLVAADLVCPPALRPATILLIAMLGAPGTSILRNIYSINRGYDGLVSRLSALGASIEQFEESKTE